MVRKNLNNFFVALIANVIVLNVYSQIVSPFNKLKVEDTIVDYSFIVSGHFHGASTNASTFPASSILANIDTLNSFHASFLVSLGDMFLDVNGNYIEHYERTLFRKLNMPVFNAVGNHDLSNGNIYEKLYGNTFYSFKCGAEFFIFLNTETNDGSIVNEQFDFFKNEIGKVNSDEIKNIFIFSHRPVWAENNVRYKNLFKGNTRTAIGENNFESEIKPKLKEVSKEKCIYWISGSMASGPASFFYHKDPETNVTFMQTAIRDLPRDAVLLVKSKNGIITMKGISLTGEKLKPIENYNIDFWTEETILESKFNFRLLPLQIFNIVSHIYFWIGVISCFILFSLILLVNKLKKK